MEVKEVKVEVREMERGGTTTEVARPPEAFAVSRSPSLLALTTLSETLQNRRPSSRDLMRLIQVTFLSLALWVIIPLSEQLKSSTLLTNSSYMAL
jgi:hypothetical protein